MAETKTNTEAHSKLPIEDQLHIWFEKNRKMIVLACAAVILAALGFIFWYWNRSAAEADAAAAFAKAKSVPELESVVAKYPGTKAAPRALMLAADGYFSEGKYKEAQAAYERFLPDHPEDEFASSAQFGVAACLEAQADLAKAATAYETLRSNYRDSIHVGEAEIALARIAEAQGNPQRAKEILENFVAAMPSSPWAREAETHLEMLRRKLKSLAPAPASPPSFPSVIFPSPAGSPAPAPAPNPAPAPAQ